MRERWTKEGGTTWQKERGESESERNESEQLRIAVLTFQYIRYQSLNQRKGMFK